MRATLKGEHLERMLRALTSHPAHAGYVEGTATKAPCPRASSSHPAHAGYVEGCSRRSATRSCSASHPAHAGYVEGGTTYLLGAGVLVACRARWLRAKM